jgi:glycosyltransferase involved in cell wall biosynthesis
MPTYNHARFIGTAIESVLAQTFDAWELLIVDDGSTDGTLEIARGFTDPRICIVAHEHRGLAGLCDAYRAVLEQSSAPLVAILEGDDCWPAGKLARQVADFEKPDVVLSYGVGGLIDECGCEYGVVKPWFAPAIRTNRPTGVILPSLLSGNPILSPTVVVRRSALETVGGFWQPEQVQFVDHPTWLLLAMQGAFAYQKTIVGWWRRHSAQWTTRTAQSHFDSIPEAAYVSVVAERYLRSGLATDTALLDGSFVRRHADRARLNRWRLAILSGSRRDMAKSFVELVRSGQPRLIGAAFLGLALRGMGSDLEWVQRSRDLVSWPSRRHVHKHECNEAPGRPAPAAPDSTTLPFDRILGRHSAEGETDY